MPDTPPRTPHSRHRAELRERAFELHCQLQSNRAIAVALDVPERTVRSWIKDIMDETTRSLKKRRVEFLREAVVGQRAIAAAAWNAFNLTLDHERARLAEGGEGSVSPSPRGTPWREDREVRGVRHSRTEPGPERSGGGWGVRFAEG